MFSTKDRRPFLKDSAIRERMHIYLKGICDNQDCPSLIVGGVEDHVHITCRLSKNLGVSKLIAELKKGTIFTFDYSFRGGLEADAGFLIGGADGGVFFCVGQPTNIHFVGLEQVSAPVEGDSEGEGDDDSMDFGMM